MLQRCGVFEILFMWGSCAWTRSVALHCLFWSSMELLVLNCCMLSCLLSYEKMSSSIFVLKKNVQTRCPGSVSISYGCYYIANANSISYCCATFQLLQHYWWDTLLSCCWAVIFVVSLQCLTLALSWWLAHAVFVHANALSMLFWQSKALVHYWSVHSVCAVPVVLSG